MRKTVVGLLMLITSVVIVHFMAPDGLPPQSHTEAPATGGNTQAPQAAPVGGEAAARTASPSQTYLRDDSNQSDIFTNIRNILMVVATLGVLGLAASAFFGHFQLRWALGLLVGLALVAIVSQLISYFGPYIPTP